ncbi:MAG: glycosyltransferase family 2 protein [Deltaproteobacteria bacterium]|nr:glycosyltransferase family 2 protein [Deltaproteobacteria bacterium]
MTIPGNIEKYLTHYSVGTRWRIVSGSLRGIDTVVVIPALAESGHIFKTIAGLSENPPDELSRTLVVCVINNGDADVVSADAFTDNQRTLKILRRLIDDDGGDVPNSRQSVYFDRIRQSGLRVAYIDASSPGMEMPGKSAGVGFARKIGMDLALKVFNYDNDYPKLLLCLDADTLVEPNYLSAVRDFFEKERATTSVIAFAHQDADSADEQAAICCYEIFLRYYVLSLRWAGSPYAFHSIGSTMVCTAGGYATVRGMNKRRAGEDFYFLDKLAKIGRVGRITATTVHPSSRQSRRVPFGTGKRVIRFTEGNESEYSLYNPRSFAVLKEWLEYMSSCRDMDPETILAHAADMHPSLEMFLHMRRFCEVWPRIVTNSGDEAHLSSHFSRWFDGFETFKLIRHLTNNGLPPVDMFDALRQLMEMMGKKLPVEIQPGFVPPFQEQMGILDYLRKIDR